MNTQTLPTYSVQDLNQAIGNLLERGFAPRFLVNGTVSRIQLKKGHLWITLTDGQASISAVVWSSQLKKISFQPNDDDGVQIVGRLNFWQSRATLVVQVLDIRPNLSTVLRKFEIVSSLLKSEGLINEDRKRTLPEFPKSIVILTSIPSSALSDILRTAKERWPLTKLILISIPVQGQSTNQIRLILIKLSKYYKSLQIDALVLARGGGDREDLMIFDDEEICREIAKFPIPVVTGIGHEDDLTVADLVADYRAATPTAAIIKLLPSINSVRNEFLQNKKRLKEICFSYIRNQKQIISYQRNLLCSTNPLLLIEREKIKMQHRKALLRAISPETIMSKGFAIVSDLSGNNILSVKNLSLNDSLLIKLFDGEIESKIYKIH